LSFNQFYLKQGLFVKISFQQHSHIIAVAGSQKNIFPATQQLRAVGISQKVNNTAEKGIIINLI
jgi:hypothetical protein